LELAPDHPSYISSAALTQQVKGFNEKLNAMLPYLK
jgi:hypothetical protein